MYNPQFSLAEFWVATLNNVLSYAESCVQHKTEKVFYKTIHVCGMADRQKGVGPYFQSGPLLEVDIIANLIWTCKEPVKLRLHWMKLCSSDIHYTTVPQTLKGDRIRHEACYKRKLLKQQKEPRLKLYRAWSVLFSKVSFLNEIYLWVENNILI